VLLPKALTDRGWNKAGNYLRFFAVGLVHEFLVQLE
jgi:hypothetical protein